MEQLLGANYLPLLLLHSHSVVSAELSASGITLERKEERMGFLVCDSSTQCCF